MVNFDKFSSENTVIFDDFSPKIAVVRPKYVSRGSIQEGVLLTRIRYSSKFCHENYIFMHEVYFTTTLFMIWAH